MATETAEQRAAIERLRKLSANGTMEAVYADSKCRDAALIDHIQDLWEVARLALAEHPSDDVRSELQRSMSQLRRDNSALAARVAELEAEKAKWENDKSLLNAIIDTDAEVYAEMRKRVAELEQQVAALRADAERYRWLRISGVHAYDFMVIQSDPSDGETYSLEGPTLDAAIDAARSADAARE